MMSKNSISDQNIFRFRLAFLPVSFWSSLVFFSLTRDGFTKSNFHHLGHPICTFWVIFWQSMLSKQMILLWYTSAILLRKRSKNYYWWHRLTVLLVLLFYGQAILGPCPTVSFNSGVWLDNNRHSIRKRQMCLHKIFRFALFSIFSHFSFTP
jgi:hypothetical protein